MKIPEKIKIGGHDYKIVFPYLFPDNGNLLGLHDILLEEIKIQGHDGWGNKRKNSSVVITLIHEVLHAVDAVTGHGVFKDNEAAIEGFSEIMFQILKDNGFITVEEEPEQQIQTHQQPKTDAG